MTPRRWSGRLRAGLFLAILIPAWSRPYAVAACFRNAFARIDWSQVQTAAIWTAFGFALALLAVAWCVWSLQRALVRG